MHKRVIIVRSVKKEIISALEFARDLHEVGGVLIGYTIACLCIVVACTIPHLPDFGTKTSLALDGEYHSKLVEEYVNRFKIKPKFIGVWHSHICDGLNFSEQDRKTNMEIANLYGEVLSILVMRTQDMIEGKGWCVSSDGKMYLCMAKKWLRKKGSL